MKTHIPKPGGQRTLCGRPIRGSGTVSEGHAAVTAIDLETTPIDDATCLSCHRSDDAQSLAECRREIRELTEADDPRARHECESSGIPYHSGSGK